MSHPKVRVGTAYLLIAQGIFFVSSYALHVFLGRYLGPVEYGLFGVALYAATMIRTLVGAGIPMAVARYVSSEPERAEAIFRKGLYLQTILAAIVSLVFFLTAPALARLLGDVTLIPLFRLVAPITVFFGIFFLVIQYFNGQRRYGIQSVWLSVSYLLRAALGITLAVVGFRVFGAVAGLVGSSAIVALLTILARKPESRHGDPYPASTLIQFSTPLMLAAIGQSFLIDLDLMFVKKLVPDGSYTGYYTSAKTIAQVAPFGFFALTSALYPAVASAFSTGNMIKLKDYIQQAHRFTLVIILPLFLIVFWDNVGMINLFYGAKYTPAASALRWLMLSFSLLSFFLIHRAIIAGCGFPKTAGALTLTLLPICVTLHLVLIPVYGIVGAAVASATTTFAGVVASMIVVYHKFNAGFHLPSTLRIVCAALLVFILDVALTQLGLALIPKWVVLGIVYVLVLRMMGEWRVEEFRELFVDFFKLAHG